MSEYFFTKNGDTYDIFQRKEGQKIDRVACLDIGRGARWMDREQWDGILEVVGKISEHAIDQQGRDIFGRKTEVPKGDDWEPVTDEFCEQWEADRRARQEENDPNRG